MSKFASSASNYGVLRERWIWCARKVSWTGTTEETHENHQSE